MYRSPWGRTYERRAVQRGSLVFCNRVERGRDDILCKYRLVFSWQATQPGKHGGTYEVALSQYGASARALHNVLSGAPRLDLPKVPLLLPLAQSYGVHALGCGFSVPGSRSPGPTCPHCLGTSVSARPAHGGGRMLPLRLRRHAPALVLLNGLSKFLSPAPEVPPYRPELLPVLPVLVLELRSLALAHSSHTPFSSAHALVQGHHRTPPCHSHPAVVQSPHNYITYLPPPLPLSSASLLLIAKNSPILYDKDLLFLAVLFSSFVSFFLSADSISSCLFRSSYFSLSSSPDPNAESPATAGRSRMCN